MTGHKSVRRAVLGAGVAAGLAASCAQPALACGADDYIGTVCSVAFNYPPPGFMEAAGQVLQISQYSAAYAVMGGAFGTTTPTTFTLPDLRGRVVVGMGRYNGGATNFVFGSSGGAESAVLTLNQLPAHVHPLAGANVTFTNFPFSADGSKLVLNTNAGPGGSATPGSGAGTLAQSNAPAAKIYNNAVPNVAMTTGSITGTVTGALNGDAPISGNTGLNTPGNAPIATMPPYQVLNYIIAVQGLYPSRP